VTDDVVMLASVPHAAPLQPAPESDHVTPRLLGSLVTVAVKAWLWLCCTLAGFGETPTETAAITVTLADAERVVSATEVAVTVTEPLGMVVGAVYRPEAVMVPTVELPPDTPLTLQVTPLLCESLEIVAVNCCVSETFTVADVGETETPIGAVMMIVADALFVASATDVAFRVTVAGLGTLAGAL
jgi:hypothetical protein